MTFLDVMIQMLFVVIPIGIFVAFGRWLPTVPFINEWKIKAHIFEIRGNGFFPKDDLARNFTDLEGNVMFSLKKTGIKTPPKRLVEALRGADGKDHVYLLQTSRENVIPIKPKFALEIEKKVKNGETIEITNESKEILEPELNLLAKNENIFNWKKYKMKEQIRKLAKNQNWIVQNLPLMMGFLLFIGLGVFMILAVEPISMITGEGKAIVHEMQVTQATNKELAEVNLRIAERLDSIAKTITGG